MLIKSRKNATDAPIYEVADDFCSSLQSQIKRRLLAVNFKDKITAEQHLNILNFYNLNGFFSFDSKSILPQSWQDRFVSHDVNFEQAIEDGGQLDHLKAIGVADFDLAVSWFGMSWLNDLELHLKVVRASLKPNRPFLGVIIGSHTAVQLRRLLIEVDARFDRVFMRCNPCLDNVGLGNVMLSSGFKLIAIDREYIKLRYSNLSNLLQDIHSCGLAKCLLGDERVEEHNKRSQNINCENYGKAQYRYLQQKILENGLDVEFECLLFIGWSDHSSIQKPLRPGVAKRSLMEVLDRDKPEAIN